MLYGWRHLIYHLQPCWHLKHCLSKQMTEATDANIFLCLVQFYKQKLVCEATLMKLGKHPRRTWSFHNFMMDSYCGMRNVHICAKNKTKNGPLLISLWWLQDPGFLLPVSALFASPCSGMLALHTSSLRTPSAASSKQRRPDSQCLPDAFLTPWWWGVVMRSLKEAGAWGQSSAAAESGKTRGTRALCGVYE